MRLILDIGSGNTLTDNETAIKLINEIAKRDTKKYELVLKTQLFRSAPPNKPLKPEVFTAAWSHAGDVGYHLTSSVFDRLSLEFLLEWDLTTWRLPFIKIACRPDLYWMIGEIPRRIPVYYSSDGKSDLSHDEYWVEWGPGIEKLKCVREYPANPEDYKDSNGIVGSKISDHTVGWDMFNATPNKEIWEKHVYLERSPDNPDSGPFAVTPTELEGIL